MQWIPELGVHFAVPLVMQVMVACSPIICWRYMGYTSRFWSVWPGGESVWWPNIEAEW
jgi:hypothetical protein